MQFSVEDTWRTKITWPKVTLFYCFGDVKQTGYYYYYRYYYDLRNAGY
jgi:hypothetical protein